MIIINAGIPKSGTSLIQQYQMDLINTVSPRNGQQEILKHGYNIDVYSDASNQGFFVDIDEETFNFLSLVEAKFGSFMFKTHCNPNAYISKIINEKGGKATFCYRDPRDVILSAIDHGKRTRSGLDRSGAYHDLFTIDQGIMRIKKWFGMFIKWQDFQDVLFIKYEDMIENKEKWLHKMSSYFNFSISESTINNIVNKHERIKNTAWNFNVGTIYRWKHEMNTEQIKICNQSLSEEISTMGYEFE